MLKLGSLTLGSAFRFWVSRIHAWPRLLEASSGLTLVQGKSGGFVELEPLQMTLGTLEGGMNQMLKATLSALTGLWKYQRINILVSSPRKEPVSLVLAARESPQGHRLQVLGGGG